MDIKGTWLSMTYQCYEGNAQNQVRYFAQRSNLFVTQYVRPFKGTLMQI